MNIKHILAISCIILTATFSAANADGKSSRPETWFHLIGGNVSYEGLTADLEAIKAAGIGGIHLFHGQMGEAKAWPGVSEQIPCLSEKWNDMISHVASECRRLGLAFKMQNCPGWSMSGGFWISAWSWTAGSVSGTTLACAGGGCIRKVFSWFSGDLSWI